MEISNTFLLNKIKILFYLSISISLLILGSFSAYEFYERKQKRKKLDHYYCSYLFLAYAHSEVNPNDEWGSKFADAIESEMLKVGYDRSEINDLTMKAIKNVKEASEEQI